MVQQSQHFRCRLTPPQHECIASIGIVQNNDENVNVMSQIESPSILIGFQIATEQMQLFLRLEALLFLMNRHTVAWD